MNLDLFNQTLEVAEHPGLDTTDPRLDDISTSVEQGQYLEAAAQVEAVYTEGIYDVRILGFFMYGAFLEGGMGSLKDIFNSLTGILRDNWPAFGPVSKKEKHAQTSLRWFANQLLKKSQYEETTKGETWNKWISEVSSDQVQDVLDAAEAFQRVLGSVLEDAAGPILDALTKVIKWLKSFQQIVYREPAPEPEAEPEPVEEEEAQADEPESEEPSAPSQRKPSQAPGSFYTPVSSPDEGAAFAEGSYLLKLLMKKMEAFDQLITEEKFPRAALVADDINEILAAFDPKLYFPKLFARFSLLLALHIGDLSAYEENKESVEWKALKEFYKVDLEGFVSF